MLRSSLKNAHVWLGLTEQQFRILLSIFKLTSDDLQTTPKNIESQYLNDYDTVPQKSNLFTQLRYLISRDFVKKEGYKSYSVNFETIYSVLDKARAEKVTELEQFNKISLDMEDYFRKAALQTMKPQVTYYDYAGLYAEVTKSLKHADCFITTLDFPDMCYSYGLSYGLNISGYVQIIWERCFKQKTLEVLCLTNLNIDYLFNHAFRLYGNPWIACDECQIALDQLLIMVENCANFDLRYLKNPFGLNIFMPEKRKLVEFFIYMRDMHRNISGGIAIKSHETADNTKKLFEQEFEYAERVSDTSGKKVIMDLKQELKRKYEP